MSENSCNFAAIFNKWCFITMTYNSYNYNVNPTLRLGRKVAPAMGTAYICVPASADLVV